MADLEDVMAVLAAKCAVTMYPKGIAAGPIVGNLIRTVQGWPDATALDKDLAAGNVQVSIYPLAMERNTTRFQRAWETVGLQATTLTLSVAGDTVTVGGAMPVPFSPHNLAVLVNGTGYTYSVQASDTLTSIATALAMAIGAGYPHTTSAGPVITVAGAESYAEPLVARVGGIGMSVREVRRQKRLFQITIWAPSPAARRPVSEALDVALQKDAFLTMPDGTAAHIIYSDSPMTDMMSKSRLYRRDLRYFVEYATTEQEDNAVVVLGRVALQDPVTGADLSITDY